MSQAAADWVAGLPARLHAAMPDTPLEECRLIVFHRRTLRRFLQSLEPPEPDAEPDDPLYDHDLPCDLWTDLLLLAWPGDHPDRMPGERIRRPLPARTRMRVLSQRAKRGERLVCVPGDAMALEATPEYRAPAHKITGRR